MYVFGFVFTFPYFSFTFIELFFIRFFPTSLYQKHYSVACSVCHTKAKRTVTCQPKPSKRRSRSSQLMETYRVSRPVNSNKCSFAVVKFGLPADVNMRREWMLK